jgi:predicted nucleotidyltransferase
LAADCNPNIIELLFIRSEDVLVTSVAGDLLRHHRTAFLSQKAAKTFVGYSTAQLHRIKQHKAYLMNPPDHKPARQEYGLAELSRVNPDQLNACRAFVRRNMNTMAPWLLEADNQHREAFWEGVVNLLAIRDGTPEFNNNVDNWHEIEEQFAEDIAAKMSFDTDFMEHLRLEKRFSQAKSEYDKYLEWQKNRNPERAALEQEWGFDLKHGLHLIRLLRMGHQVLTTGTMDVYRPDRQELLDIRHGKWPYEKLVEESTRLTDEIYTLIREDKTCLPKLPNMQILENLNQECLEIHYQGAGKRFSLMDNHA